MGTALIYLLVIAAVAAAVFGLSALVFGRGEELAPLPPGATPTRLPAGEVHGRDVRELRFQQVLRGYRMDEVDWALGRLADELDRGALERAELVARVRELESSVGAERSAAVNGTTSGARAGEEGEG
ncbi:DivIVA domain-containing protein [Pseudonocardia lacus]|uniref:DivIVA domain-containing protein n=1 Tax=Pseudonocardia lacus TaxID=2835865 RepID=UPI001BDBD57B|nr:DivIVA domain-containing protein [Pseudonocardia lacus]